MRLLAAIPNTLSLTRLVLGAVFAWVPAGGRVVVVLAAALTDLLDGVLGRRLQATSPVGRILDPVADKVFVFAVLATLLVEGSLEVWQVALVGLRDLVVLAGAGWMAARREWPTSRPLPPTLLGKLTTAAQFVFLLTLLAQPQRAEVAFWPTALLSGLAAAHYAWRFLSGPPPDPGKPGTSPEAGGVSRGPSG